MANIIVFVTARLDEAADDAARGYLKALALPGYDGWDLSTTAGLPPAVTVQVLRDIEAKRHLLKWHQDEPCCVCLDDVDACPVFCALAYPYDRHPEYKAAWHL